MGWRLQGARSCPPRRRAAEECGSFSGSPVLQGLRRLTTTSKICGQASSRCRQPPGRPGGGRAAAGSAGPSRVFEGSRRVVLRDSSPSRPRRAGGRLAVSGRERGHLVVKEPSGSKLYETNGHLTKYNEHHFAETDLQYLMTAALHIWAAPSIYYRFPHILWFSGLWAHEQNNCRCVKGVLRVGWTPAAAGAAA